MPDQASVPARGHAGSVREDARLRPDGQTHIVVTHDPPNAEAPLHALREACTPAEHFYIRCHFPVPSLVPESLTLRVEGAVERPIELSFDALRALSDLTITATLECAGNDRIRLAPLPWGEPWGSGAVSTGVWRGVPLHAVLERAGLLPSALEILFEGADRGRPDGSEDEVAFARSLPLAKALDPGTLLAYMLNDAPLGSEHGGPIRLLVPDWYGMASVKWLRHIVALEQPFEGYYQAQSYVLHRPGRTDKEPLRAMQVKSLITSPVAGDVLPLGRHRVSGAAWSGESTIVRVELSTEGEGAWQPARLIGQPVPHAWRQWEWEWEASEPGRQTLRVRAIDAQGNTQPDVGEWNRLGYANNAIQVVAVEVRP